MAVNPLLRALVLAALMFIGWHLKGVTDERNRLLEAVAAQQEATKRAEQVTTVTAEVVTARMQSKAAIRTRVQEVQHEIEERIPADAGNSIPGYLRMLHDASATGGEIPEAPSGADGAPLTPQEAASTINENYGIARDNADKLTKLQQWIEGVTQ